MKGIEVMERDDGLGLVLLDLSHGVSQTVDGQCRELKVNGKNVRVKFHFSRKRDYQDDIYNLKCKVSWICKII